MNTPLSIAQDSVNVQDACNISGVAKSLFDLIVDLRKANPDCSTDDIARHPAVKLFVHKLVDLSGAYNQDDFSEAYHAMLAVTETA